KLRKPFEDADFEIQITGFAKQIGDIADGAKAVLVFCVIALLLTALSVYWYCHSLRFTILPIVCSLTSLVWQFGTLRLLGFGLDPLGVLVPFLVFAIGVSHGVQQINFITRELADGKSSFDAARHSFTGLLIPGTLALVTAFVSFITLLLIPIPMIRELAITASLGVAYKIVTNLVMLPLAASCLHLLSVVTEAPPASCESPAVGGYGDDLESALKAVPGVVSISSFAGNLRAYNEGYNEGNPKMNVVPIDPGNYAGLATEIGRVR